MSTTVSTPEGFFISYQDYKVIQTELNQVHQHFNCKGLREMLYSLSWHFSGLVKAQDKPVMSPVSHAHQQWAVSRSIELLEAGNSADALSLLTEYWRKPHEVA